MNYFIVTTNNDDDDENNNKIAKTVPHLVKIIIYHKLL
jgi:hypothetical protein